MLCVCVCVCMCVFLTFFIKVYVVGTHLNCISIYTADIEYTDCNLNTSELLDCMWGNTVISYFIYYNSLPYLLYA